MEVASLTRLGGYVEKTLKGVQGLGAIVRCGFRVGAEDHRLAVYGGELETLDGAVRGGAPNT